MKHRLILALLAVGLLSGAALVERWNAPAPDGIRPAATLGKILPAPELADPVEDMPLAGRLYPDQPPVIPHNIRNYQVDRFFNKCLSCHSREMSPETGAPMVSTTHYQQVDGQRTAAIDGRRYFCTQCHVPQHQVDPLVENRFKTVESLIREAPAGNGN